MKKFDKNSLIFQSKSMSSFPVSYFSVETYIAKANLMSKHDIYMCFPGEIRKILRGYPSCQSGAMNMFLEEG